jgi:hypothetical protein
VRLLALIPPGTNARAMFQELVDGLEAAGAEVHREDAAPFVTRHNQLQAAASPTLPQLRTLYARHLESLARTTRADAILTCWVDPLLLLPWLTRDGRLVSFTESLGIPAIHWWLDAPFWAYQGQLLPALDGSRFTSAHHLHLVNNAGTAHEMERLLGFNAVLPAPYGVDAQRLHPWPAIKPTHDLAINAGPGDPPPTPLMLRELERDAPDVQAIRTEQAERATEALARLLQPQLGGQSHDAASYAIQAQRDDPDRPMLGSGGKLTGTPLESLASPGPDAARLWAEATTLVRTIDHWRRAFTACWLARRVKTLHIGEAAEHWTKLGWPVAGDRTGPVLRHELTAYYAHANVGLNVMRYQDDVGMNPKPLEIMAASRAPLVQRRAITPAETSEHWLAFDHPAEALHQLKTARSDPDALARRGEANRAVAETVASWPARAAVLLEQIRGHLEGSMSPASLKQQAAPQHHAL